MDLKDIGLRGWQPGDPVVLYQFQEKLEDGGWHYNMLYEPSDQELRNALAGLGVLVDTALKKIRELEKNRSPHTVFIDVNKFRDYLKDGETNEAS